MISISFVLFGLIWSNYGETIDRNTVGDTSAVSCNSFPCIINCNAATSCSSTTIACPATGSGNCTINVLSNGGAKESTINTGSSSNVELNLRGYESLWTSIINVGNVNNFIVNVENADRAMRETHINIESVTGNLLFNANGNSHTFYNMELIISGSVGGDISFLSNTKDSFKLSSISVNGDVGGNVLVKDTASGGYGFYNSFFNFSGNIEGNASFIEQNNLGASFWSNEFVIHSVGGDLLFQSVGTGKNSFYDSTFDIGPVTGHLSFLSSKHGSFQSCHITVNGDVGGNVMAKDTASGSYIYGFYDSFFNFSGDIGESASFMGNSFFSNEFVIHSVGGDLLFQSVGTGAYWGSFHKSTFDIGSVTGHLSFFSNKKGAFKLCHITVNGDVGGDVMAEDTASGGNGFYDSFFNFYGDIGGSASFIDNNNLGASFSSNEFVIHSVGDDLLFQSVGTGTNSFYGSTFDIGPVIGNLSFLSSKKGSFQSCHITVNGDVGGSVMAKDTASGSYIYGFYHSFFNFYGDIGESASFIGNSFFWDEFVIHSVGGDLLIQSIGTGTYKDSFRRSIFDIGSVTGHLSVLSNTYNAYRDCLFNINTVNIDSKFIGTASGGSDFFSADINIENCPYVEISADKTYGIYDSRNYFGSGVGLVNITANGGKMILYSTLFDAQNANEIILNCHNDADCTKMEIKCPDDNKENKCRVYCDKNANCNNIDLFTTNGYCLDASFNCLDSVNECQIDSTSQVFCVKSTSSTTTYQYGERSNPQCTMNGIYCINIGTAECSEEAVCLPPSAIITSAAPIPIPTAMPTTMPTFEPCTVLNEPYYIQFILDESGSIKQQNYIKSINFIENLIRNDINPISKVSILSFAEDNDDIYKFTENELKTRNGIFFDRNGILNALEIEKNDYIGGITDTYNALKRGIELFNEDTSITSNKLLFLITDGVPRCAQKDTECTTDICGQQQLLDDLSNNNIYVRILGIGHFDSSQLNCLVQDVTNDIYLMDSFTDKEFKRIERKFRRIVCPQTVDDGSVGGKNIYGTNIYHNNNDYKWLVVNVSISVILTVFVILICYLCCYKVKRNGKYEKVVNIDI